LTDLGCQLKVVADKTAEKGILFENKKLFEIDHVQMMQA
jgi:hypothetical protein